MDPPDPSTDPQHYLALASIFSLQICFLLSRKCLIGPDQNTAS
jgi:hypothetical protein